MELTNPGPSQRDVGLTRTSIVGGLRFSQLSPPRQALVRLCQRINYGSVEGLGVRAAEPMFSPPPRVYVDVKLDTDEAARLEVDLPDFEVPSEVRRLIGLLEDLKEGTIDRIEIRAGVPRRIIH